MASTEERIQILKMIESGTISAKEGAELLKALDQNDPSPKPQPLKGASEPRWFRVRVTDIKSGRNKVNVNIPIGLVNVGIKMGARFAPEVEGFDYQELVAAIRSGQQGKIFDVINNDDGEQVEVFIE